MKSVHEGDTLVVWKLDRLARSARQLIDTVDLARERRRVPKSDRRARHDEPVGTPGLPHIRRRPRLCPPIRTFGSPRSRRARCMLRFATHWAPPHGWSPLQLCWDACIVGRAPSATRLICLTRLLQGVKAIKFAGRAAGRGRPACRPETEARACLWASLIRAGRGRSYH
jgi:Resolvase, N terminal domain